MLRKIRVRAYCSTANLGPGFDVLALALDAFYDEVEIEVLKKGLLEVDFVNVDNIPSDPRQNTAGLAALSFMKRLGIKAGVRIRVYKGVPIGMGLGSSGATAAATVVALAKLFGVKLDHNELIEIAAQGEIASAGAPHADNVSASVLGGFVLIRSYEPLDVIPLRGSSRAIIVLAMPQIKVPAKKTELARKVLPKHIPLKHMVHNVGHAATIVAGILLDRPDLIGRGMHDVVVEPARAKLIPAYHRVKEYALRAGAYGVAVSGAGPSMIAITDTREKAREIAKAMERAYREEGIDVRLLITRPGPPAQVIMKSS